MIRIAGMMNFDISDCDNGMCLSIWFQGCPHHCKGCHNPETWNFNEGMEIPDLRFYNTLLHNIYKLESRTQDVNISLLGGEPLCPENIDLVFDVLKYIESIDLESIPKFYCWTGYYLETELNQMAKKNKKLRYILDKIDVLIDGRFEIDKRDTTLKLRGSSNQTIWRKKRCFLKTFDKFVREEK